MWCVPEDDDTPVYLGVQAPQTPIPPKDPLKSPKYPVMTLNAPPLQNPPNTLIPLTFGFQGHFAKFWRARAVQPESQIPKYCGYLGGGVIR